MKHVKKMNGITNVWKTAIAEDLHHVIKLQENVRTIYVRQAIRDPLAPTVKIIHIPPIIDIISEILIKF